MFDNLKNALRLPETRNIDSLDDPQASELHSQIIQNKPFLRKIYLDFYSAFCNCAGHDGQKKCIELGSGGGFLKEILPDVITSDILKLSQIDICFSGLDIPFKNNSIDAFFMIDVFHHVKYPETFLLELDRCLKPGGQIVMIEPANTWWGRFIYKNFHHEPFDTDGDWKIEGSGPMSDANGALPWIVFCRDREKFNSKFKNLNIEHIKFHTPYRYLISGGVSMKQLLPSFMYPVIKFIEIILTPLNRWLGMFMTVKLKKR